MLLIYLLTSSASGFRIPHSACYYWPDYFNYHSDIGNIDFLAEQAAAAGVFETEDAAREWLHTDELKDVSNY